ncbi:MAG TPA: homoserine kinase [Gammaproteobacteria bacterium]|nr:homoserine kinase [Gammaproteobacteria bacterium]
MHDLQTVTAYAPATCGNVIVGFDILGLAISNVGDKVTLTRRQDSALVITHISGIDSLPTDPKQNIASAVIAQLLADLNLNWGFDIELHKGIPLSSGLGGSAASAAAALMALNQFLPTPLSLTQLAHYAMLGEALCSGQAHPDNIVPALYGGITLITEQNPIQVVSLPIPDIVCVLVHPHLELTTRKARSILAASVPLHAHCVQSAYLAGFISALYQKDLNLIAQSLRDVIIEPQREQLVPGFSAVKKAALAKGALGASLSGSGPTVLAFARDAMQAEQVGLAMQAAFAKCGITSNIYLSPISQQGAYVM